MIRDKGKEHEISSTQIETIIFLSGAHSDNKNVTSIARRLQIAQPTATRVVNSLVERDLVKRERSEVDRRKIKLILTDRGRSITKDINEISRTLINAVEELSGSRQKELNKDLVKIAGELQSKGHIAIALTCQYCRYFERNGGNSEERPHLCRLTGQDLGEDESHSEWVHKESDLDLFK